MTARLNRQLFEVTIFDSGALGMTTSVIHQFTEPSIYHASIRRNGRHVGETRFEVRKEATRLQLDIDLATAVDRRHTKTDCLCDEANSTIPVVSPQGYVLFFTTSGNGWSVQIGEGKQAVFDSTRLTKGDMFALMLLEPTQYRIENTIAKVTASAEVTFSGAEAKRLSGLQPVMVEAGNAFKPEKLKLVSTQGLVFRIESDARIVIRREKDREREPRRHARRIQRLRAGDVRPSERDSRRSNSA